MRNSPPDIFLFGALLVIVCREKLRLVFHSFRLALEMRSVEHGVRRGCPEFGIKFW